MQQHVKVLAVLNIIYGGLGLLIGLFVFAVLGGIAGVVSTVDPSVDAEVAAPILGLIGAFVLCVLAIVSAPSIIAGAGLLYFKPWARILTIVLSAVHLLSIPFGTALGVYGLWVLLHGQTEPLFRGTMPPVPSRPYA
jgi:hypothetical protein